MASLLNRGIQAQLRDVHDLRQETRRLFHELEYYQGRHWSSAAEASRLAENIAELERERGQFGSDLAALSEAQSQAAAKEAASQQERTALLLRADELAGQLEQMARDKERLQEETAAASQKERTALLAHADVLAGQLAQLAREKEQMRQETARLERDVDNLRGETARMFHELEGYQRRLSSSVTEANRLRERVGELETGRGQILSELAVVSAERAELLAWTDEREEQLAQLARDKKRLQEEVTRLERSLQASCSQAEQASEEYDTAQAIFEKQIATLTAGQEKQRALQASIEGELKKETALRREIYAQVRDAEELRRQVIGRVNQFQNKLAADVGLYRAQRAWKVMLAIRKGYTLHTRGAEFAAFLRWALALPFAGPGPLQEYEAGVPRRQELLAGTASRTLRPFLQMPPEESHKLAELLSTAKVRRDRSRHFRFRFSLSEAAANCRAVRA